MNGSKVRKIKTDGLKIRKFRQKRELTQSELGKKIGVSDSAIRLIETGKRNGSPEVISALANFFCVEVEDLQCDEDYEDIKVILRLVDVLIELNLVGKNYIDNEAESIINKATKEIILNRTNKKSR